MSVKMIPEWFPKVGEKVFYAIGNSAERGGFRVDDVSRQVDGYLVAKMYGDSTTADLELCAVPIGGNLEFCGEWHLQDHSQYAMFALHPTTLRVYRENGKEIVIPQAADPYFERIHIINSQRELLDQLGIPEDSELAGVELPDMGDEVVVRCKTSHIPVFKATVVCVGVRQVEYDVEERGAVVCQLSNVNAELIRVATANSWWLIETGILASHRNAEVEIIRSER